MDKRQAMERIMEIHNWTNGDVADMVGSSVSRISEIRNGATPSLELAGKLWKLFRLPFPEMFPELATTVRELRDLYLEMLPLEAGLHHERRIQ